jgi:outer membrane protein assembly factor BamB
LHGARRAHRARGRGPREAKAAWSVDVGGAVEAQVTASPDEKTLYASSLGGRITAIARDGTERWRVDLGDRVYSTPCVADDGTIYVGSDGGRFSAISSDGRVLWRLETGADADTGAAVTKSGAIVFAAGQAVFAVRSGGDVGWRFQAKRKVFTSPALADDGTIIFGAQDHRVYALTPQGTLAWATDLGADVDGGPAIGDDGEIYVGTDGDEVVRLDGNGNVAWRVNVGGFVRGPLSIARNGDVLAGVYGPAPRQVRISPTGAIWGAFAIQGTGAREFGVHGGALEDDDGALYFGAQDDNAYAIEPNGALRWRFHTGGDVDAPLTLLSDGSLVVPSDDGRVYLIPR